MIELDFLTELGLDCDTATALLELITEETDSAAQSAARTISKLPRVTAVTPGGMAGERERTSFAAMSYGERLKLKNENPLLYDELAEQTAVKR